MPDFAHQLILWPDVTPLTVGALVFVAQTDIELAFVLSCVTIAILTWCCAGIIYDNRKRPS